MAFEEEKTLGQRWQSLPHSRRKEIADDHHVYRQDDETLTEAEQASVWFMRLLDEYSLALLDRLF
jgi:hypothetical protein